MKKDYKDEKNWRLGGIACVPIPEGIEVFVDMILIVSKKCFSYWHEDKTSYKILMYFSANIYNKTRINDKFCFRSDLLSFLSVFFFFLFCLWGRMAGGGVRRLYARSLSWQWPEARSWPQLYVIVPCAFGTFLSLSSTILPVFGIHVTDIITS